MQSMWRAVIAGLFIIVLTSCSANEPAMTSEQSLAPPKEYLEWRQQVEAVLKDTPYILPGYDPDRGPIEMVYTDVSPASVSFELLHSDTYKVHSESSGVYTVHSLFYSYSWNQAGKEWDDSRILARTGLGAITKPERKQVDAHTSILHDRIVEYREGDLRVYQDYDRETQEQNKDLQAAIIGFLKEKGIDSAQVEIVTLERETQLDLQMVIDTHYVRFYFAVDKHFSDQTTRQLDHYLGDIGKLTGK